MREKKSAVAEREEVVLGSCGEGKEMVKRRGEGKSAVAGCRENKTENPTKKQGGAALEEKKIRFFLGLGLFFFFCCKKCPPFCLAENEGYL